MLPQWGQRYIPSESSQSLTSFCLFAEEDKRATTNVQNGVVFLYYLLVSFRLFELNQ